MVQAFIIFITASVALFAAGPSIALPVSHPVLPRGETESLQARSAMCVLRYTLSIYHPLTIRVSASTRMNNFLKEHPFHVTGGNKKPSPMCVLHHYPINIFSP
jgi:hypothetical protein